MLLNALMLETCEKILKLLTSLCQRGMHVISKGFTAHSSTPDADLIEMKRLRHKEQKELMHALMCP